MQSNEPPFIRSEEEEIDKLIGMKALDSIERNRFSHTIYSSLHCGRVFTENRGDLFTHAKKSLSRTPTVDLLAINVARSPARSEAEGNKAIVCVPYLPAKSSFEDPKRNGRRERRRKENQVSVLSLSLSLSLSGVISHT